ncbi:LCP family protein [Bifidobacterium choloepi]
MPASFAPRRNRSPRQSSSAHPDAAQSAAQSPRAAQGRTAGNVAREQAPAGMAGESGQGAQSDVPPSFSPNGHAHESRAPRSSQGSTNRQSSAYPTGGRTPDSHGGRSGGSRRPSMPSLPSRGGRSAAAQRAGSRADRRHRARTVVVSVLLVIVVVLGIAFAGLYGWVNSNLNKQEWLTSMADNSKATTWLILGSDERDGTTGDDGTTGARTDTILVLTKPKSGAASLVSIPRDSLVQVDGYYMKINAVLGDYGNQAMVGEIEDITGYKIDHVAELSFGGLVKVVDALGGVELCYDDDVNDEKSGMVWTAGCHVADGTTALAFSRMRYSDPNGDFGRAERQRQVIGAIAKKAASASTLLNFGKDKAVAEAVLGALTVDEKTTPFTLVQMLLAFKSASGNDGITGSVYWSDPDYYVDGVGSSVLLDDAQNTELFKELNEGTHAAGTVGTLADES